MDEALDWRRHRQAWADALERQTGYDVAAWNERIALANPADEAALRAWLDQRGVRGRKTYVCLVTPRRTFARIQASKRSRVDVALRLEGVEPRGRLAPSRIHDTMPLQFSLEKVEDLDEEARGWLEQARLRNS